MPYIPHTEAELGEMLKVIGANSLDDLLLISPLTCGPKASICPRQKRGRYLRLL